MKRKLLFLLFVLVVSMHVNAQCAMCRAVLESGENQSAAEGINDGIMFLMAIPYILVAALGYIIYVKFNKPNKSEEINQKL
ncbi:hypothetical protein [Winogradskyella endarachnes]|uniref:Uncharacterized protein n=1 Tax=Winogradskyella endarachnes TaxID=2681965 RepID=A0A6L6UEL5_9FLAO|nr:hypothetical protein [Winogradskyella endarachnes]MUU79234.1 hypothetical protein [Winogradskyella endarachnes]